eukprot:CAMPEP_0172567906 /NCGR_PEP_ID=MMETSP1067-20121228/117692_1 /TAXON_ID=265564 ORGANISM="Thalassiosira punctigera, Strain Tpunct2005C2" /NCGR_SAMPLE_ID=MMETSP1067 /ASSEMBLY_ACC=CAM_ASM_000444 /LENGTH=101 /DNA_ID=CAMNT_0013359361 /DNA_START=107 /DNA_END=409 /DNA_ORIENTATION=+
MSESLRTKLQSITTVDARRTLQNKTWNYIESNIEDLSAVSLDAKLAPYFLTFVARQGGVNSLFSVLHSRDNSPDLFFDNPTPERLRLTPEMEKARERNAVL